MKSAIETWLSKFKSPIIAIRTGTASWETNPKELVTRSTIVQVVPAEILFATKVGVAPISSPWPAAAPVSPKMPSLSRSQGKDSDSVGSESEEALASI